MFCTIIKHVLHVVGWHHPTEGGDQEREWGKAKRHEGHWGLCEERERWQEKGNQGNFWQTSHWWREKVGRI